MSKEDKGKSDGPPSSNVGSSGGSGSGGVGGGGASAEDSKEMVDYYLKSQSKSAGLDTADKTDGASLTKPSDADLTAKKSIDDTKSSSLIVHQAYGNYYTVSGADAKVLQDVFNKNFQVSALKSADAKSKRGLLSQGVRFSSPKDSIDEYGYEEENSASVRSHNRTESRTLRDLFMRKRNKSGPVGDSANSSTVTADAKPKTRVRTLFASFRNRPRSVSVSDAPVGSPLMHSQVAPKTALPPATATVGKKKKFKVTPAVVNQRGDYQRISPEDFLEMYRTRTSSDPRAAAVQRARAVTLLRKKEATQKASSESSSTDERRNSDPALHDLPPINPKVSNYATVSGIAALKLSNYQKLSAHAGNNDEREVRPFEPVHVVIWKDKKKGNRVFALTIALVDLDPTDLTVDGTCQIKTLNILVKKAFYALLQNGVRAAALWDSPRQDLVGMLTITDFIQVLQKYYKCPQEQINELESQKIATWRDMLCEDKRPLVSIGPSDSVLSAVQRLYDAKVHRILVINPATGNPLHVLTYKRILRFVFSSMANIGRPSFMKKTLVELGIGTYEKTATRSWHEVAVTSIVDSNGRVVDIYSKFDAIDLANDKAYYNLDITVQQALKNRRENFEGVQTCKKTDVLFDVIQKIVNADVHRLVVVDDAHHVEGIVSLSDILHYLVISPAEPQSTSPASPPPAVQVTGPGESGNTASATSACTSNSQQPDSSATDGDGEGEGGSGTGVTETDVDGLQLTDSLQQRAVADDGIVVS